MMTLVFRNWSTLKDEICPFAFHDEKSGNRIAVDPGQRFSTSFLIDASLFETLLKSSRQKSDTKQDDVMFMY